MFAIHTGVDEPNDWSAELRFGTMPARRTHEGDAELKFGAPVHAKEQGDGMPPSAGAWLRQPLSAQLHGYGLRFGKTPDPVALGEILGPTRRILALGNDAAIVLLIPSKRIEDEPAVIRAAIFQ